MKTAFIFLFCCCSLFLSAQTPVYKNPKTKLEDRVNDLLKQMTLEEKVDLLSGTGFASKAITRLGIPELKMTDGPVGVRWDASVAFPASIMLAATFDTSLAYRYGWALGRETKAKDRNVILGPCVNINRVPHGGRNFESYGEDPFLASRIAVSYVKGVQSEGVVATTKHFAVNNQETERNTINAKVDKRALYEIYFPAFKAAVQEAKTEAIMCSYNKLNGPYASENEMLLNTVLKKEWGFDGLVMSDWGAVHSTLGTATYGLDLEMPDGAFLGKEKLLPLIQEGKVNESTIDDKVKRILRVIFRMGYYDKQLDKPQTNAPEQRAVALDVAQSGIVLLKNEKNILPLNPSSYKSVAVIGPNAEVLRSGGGSSMVTPVSAISPLQGIKNTFTGASVSFAVGARLTGDVPPIEPKYFFVPDDTTNQQGLIAEYYDNMNFSGKPKITRIDKNIGFRWGNEKPAGEIGADNYSVRWKGKLKPTESGMYELTAATDDGVRLYLDGKLVIEHWSDHAVEARTVRVNFEAGKMYDIVMEFYEHSGDAAAILGWTKPNDNELNLAVEAAKKSELVPLFLGNSQFQESEGFDRQDIDLRQNQIELIDAVSAVNPNVVVVLNAGAQVTLDPWINKVKALVWAFFPGQEGTEAIIDVLTGKVNPSGKLPFTIAKQWQDYPAYGNFPGANGEVEYKEGILVGYRYFDTKKIETKFPFGYGMSYTTFELSNLKVSSKGKYEVTVNVKNTGSAAGEEVVQLYVKDNKPKVLRPEKELKAFAKVSLNAGEQKTVTLILNKSSFEYYDDVKNQWAASKDGYTIFVGNSSTYLPLNYGIKLK